MTLYVNGVKVGSGSCSGMKASTLGLTVGKYAPTSAEFFDGQMASVRVYGLALSEQEVKGNYAADSWKTGASPSSQFTLSAVSTRALALLLQCNANGYSILRAC
jgi:hypothetical protein